MLLPWVLPGAISAVLWIWVFHPSWGVINRLLRDSRPDRRLDPLADAAEPRLRLGHRRACLDADPFTVVLIMAALSTINPETDRGRRRSTARRALQRFALHHLSRTSSRSSVVLLIYNALTAFTSYDLVYAMTGGGPGTATTLLSFQIWKESFSMYDFGAGSAVAFIVVAISALLILAITKALPSDIFKDA